MKGKPKAPKYSAGKDVDLQADLDRATKENEAAFSDMQTICDEYNAALEDGKKLTDDIASLINSIANHPKKFDEQIEKIKAVKVERLTIEQYKTEERKALIEGGALGSAIAAVGGAYAIIGKGTRKGIIGAIIALLGLIFGGLYTVLKKRKARKKVIEVINQLYADTFSLKENHAKVQAALEQVAATADNLRKLLLECEKYRGKDKLSFLPMSEDRKKLSQLVTNTASFAKLMSQKV